MDDRPIVSRVDWLAARRALLEEEKAFTRQRDALSARRRDLPWVRVETSYVFEGPDGALTFGDLFDGRSQLIIHHFMTGPDWELGCKACSFWADGYDGVVIHLNQRDVTLASVSRGPIAHVCAYKARMGWRFPWVSSMGSDFNFDFGVSFTQGHVASGGANYNFEAHTRHAGELPGLSVFHRNPAGEIFHTYPTYARGLDILNPAYNFLDLAPKGRDEDELPQPMTWLRRRFEY